MKIQETGIRMIYQGKGVFSHPDGLQLGVRFFFLQKN